MTGTKDAVNLKYKKINFYEKIIGHKNNETKGRYFFEKIKLKFIQ